MELQLELALATASPRVKPSKGHFVRLLGAVAAVNVVCGRSYGPAKLGWELYPEWVRTVESSRGKTHSGCIGKPAGRYSWNRPGGELRVSCARTQSCAGHEESWGHARELSIDGHLGDSGAWYTF